MKWKDVCSSEGKLVVVVQSPSFPDCLRLNGLQHARPPCPSPSPEVCPSSCPLHQWCHPAIYLILWRPLLLLPSNFPSIRDFSNESAVCIRWPKHWSFSFSISPSSEYSGLISLKIDWFAVQGTFRSLLQHHCLLQHSAFFTIQLSQQYTTTGKAIALTVWSLVGRVMSLIFNTLSRFVITFLPRSNRLLISRLQSPSTVILEPRRGNVSLLPPFPLLSAMQ